jgi:glycosyltransferase involved in cell wall biosynthesis
MAGHKPLVSVIIAAFNAADYIGEAIESVLAQDVPLEVLVIDDESTDDTWQVLQGFGDKILAVRQQKGGAYVARNLGARLARGEWLAFLDADDRWRPGKLAAQMAVAEADTGLVYTDCRNFGIIDRVSERQSESTAFYEGEVFEHLLLTNFIALSSVVVRRSWFERLGGFSEVHVGIQDWDLWLRFAAAGGLVKLVSEPLTEYRIHPKQMTGNLRQRAIERMNVVERALASPRGRLISHSRARQARANVLHIGAWLAITAEPRLAIKWYLRAAAYWPWTLTLYKGLVKSLINLRRSVLPGRT